METVIRETAECTNVLFIIFAFVFIVRASACVDAFCLFIIYTDLKIQENTQKIPGVAIDILAANLTGMSGVVFG